MKYDLSRLVYHRHLAYFSVAFCLLLCAISGYFLYALSSSAQCTAPEAHCCACLEVSVLDIGQGDSIYIKAPNGNSLLVDSGPAGSEVGSRISESTFAFDRSIDVLLATHPDADHIGGFQDVLNHFSTSLYIDPHVPDDTSTYKNLIKLVDDKHIPRIVARRGLHIILDADRGISFDILYPDNSFYAYRYDQCVMQNAARKLTKQKGHAIKCANVFKLETNEASIVGRLTYGDTSFLLTGDAPKDVEDYLINQYAAGSYGPASADISIGATTVISTSTITNTSTSPLHADVLKVGHHGSKNSSSLEFIQDVSPTFAAISVGAKNKYGHPAPEVLDILSHADTSTSTKIQILRTDQMGTITFESDGKIVRLLSGH